MMHRTITRENGALGCTCGEDHGPSLRLERDMYADRVAELERENERLHAELHAMRGAEQDAERHAYDAWTAGQGDWR